MSRRVAVAAGTLVVLLGLLELAAVPLATRIVGAAVARCAAYETLEVTSVARPVLPRLLVGRARDVELHASGVAVGHLRLTDAHLRIDEAVLPWAVGDHGPVPGTLTVRVDEADVERALRDRLPFGLPVEVELRRHVATVEAPGLPLALDLEVLVDDLGTVVLRPIRGGELLERFGIARTFPSGDAARVESLRIGDGALHAALALDTTPGAGGEVCDPPPTAAAVPGTGRGRT